MSMVICVFGVGIGSIAVALTNVTGNFNWKCLLAVCGVIDEKKLTLSSQQLFGCCHFVFWIFLWFLSFQQIVQKNNDWTTSASMNSNLLQCIRFATCQIAFESKQWIALPTMASMRWNALDKRGVLLNFVLFFNRIGNDTEIYQACTCACLQV